MTVKNNQSKDYTLALNSSNMEEIYLDVYASGHQNEEFWYTNFPQGFAVKHD